MVYLFTLLQKNFFLNNKYSFVSTYEIFPNYLLFGDLNNGRLVYTLLMFCDRSLPTITPIRTG